MVQKKNTINKVRIDDSKDIKSRSFYDEALPLSQQILLNGIYGKGKRQIWIVLVPILDVFIVNISLIVCYIVDLSQHNVPPTPFLPTISQIGNKPPSRYIFTFGMTASSLTTFLIVFFRYKQVSFSREDCSNSISVTVGYLSALSKLLFGAFPYHPNFRWLHYSTLISYVFFSYVYMVSQVFLTYFTKTAYSRVILLTRLITSMLMVVFGGLFCVMKLPMYEMLNKPPYNVAQSAQWTYWTLLNIYTLTFTVDFTMIRISWNIGTLQLVHQTSVEDGTISDEWSHDLYSAQSDVSSHNHDLTGRYGSSKFNNEFNIPLELTTKV